MTSVLIPDVVAEKVRLTPGDSRGPARPFAVTEMLVYKGGRLIRHLTRENALTFPDKEPILVSEEAKA